MNNVTKKFETITQKAIDKAKNLSDSSAFLDEIDKDLEIQEGLALAKVAQSKDIFSVFNNIKQVKEIRQNKEFFDNTKMNMYADMFSSTVQEDKPLNRDKSTPIADYSLSAKWKDMGLRLAAGIPQGVGLFGNYAANHMNAAGKYLFSDTDKSYDEIFAKEQAEHNGFSKFANWITSPLDKQRAKINSQHLIDYDTLMDSYENEGLLSNLALTGSFALDLTPSVAETALMAVPGVGTARGLAALGATYLAEGNKEEQGEKLGKSANQVQGVTNTTDALDIIGAAGQAAFAVPELMMLKHAAGIAKSPTRSVFDAINKTKAKQSIDEFVDNYALAPGKWLYKGAGLAARPTAALTSMAAMEAISEVGQESFKKVANEDWWDKSKEENLQDLKESAVLGAIGGATLGGGLRAVTAPISYVTNKAKEREIFETTKQNAAKLSNILNVKDMFSSSIKETTDSKGNVHQTRENPLDKFSPAEVENINNLFYNLTQESLDKYESVPDNTSEGSFTNVNKDLPLINEVITLGASGLLNNIQKDGTEIPSQKIIEESIGRATQAVNDHIDSIRKTNPNTDTDEVISTLAEFKENMKNNYSALDYYVARQMLTNTDLVKQLLNRAIGEISDTSTQNESEEDKVLSSYDNRGNKNKFDSASKLGHKLAEENVEENKVKEYTQEQLKNLKKASKFISELTGIEELAEEFDKTNTNNSKTSAVVTVQNLLANINKAIEDLSKPIDEKDDFQKGKNFQKGRNQALNTYLSVMLTGTTTATGEKKEGLAPMLKRITQRQNEGKEFDHNGKTIQSDRASLKWWLNSHRAKYGLLTYILKDLKENEAGEAIYTVPKDIDASGEVDKVFKEVKVYRGRDKIINYLETLVTIAKNNTSEEVDPGSIAESANKLIEALNNPEQIYIDDNKSLMEAVREFISIASGKHVFSTKPNSIGDLFANIRENVKEEGGAIKAALDLIDPSSSKMNSNVNKNNTTNNEEVTAKKDTQTTAKPKQEDKQEAKQDTSTNSNNSDEDTPPFDSVIDIYSTNKDKWSYLSNVTKSPLVLNIGGKEYPFVSVEHAYQSLKHNAFSKPMSEWTIAKVYSKDWNNSIKIRSELSENRENDSNIKIMKYLLEERVKQDPKFEELLKATGNLELTHIRDNTIWKEKFPQLLMEIRDNLNNKNEQGQTTPKQEGSKSNIESTSEVNSNGNNKSESFPDYSENFGKNLGKRGDHLKIDTTKSDWYSLRTVNNINGSDITIAFANDFSTRGEQMTTEAAVKANNGKGKYLRPGSGRDTKPAKISNLEALNNPKETAKEIAEFFKEKYGNKNTFTLNIAGNGIYSLKGIITQQELNSKMRDTLKELINELPGIKIQVRSGGQTGMDLAGVVAAYSLGLDTTLHMPKGWRVRPLDGKDKTFDTKESFIKYIRMNNMHKLDDSYKNKPATTQAQQQEYSPIVQKILSEASKETQAQKEFRKEELQELNDLGEGVEMEGEELFNPTIPETLDEAQQEIKENGEKLINNVIEKRDERIEEIEDPKQKSKAENERLDLNKILKAKDTPRSQLGLSIYENPENKEVKSFYKDINEALINSFGIANQKGNSVNSLITFFGNIGTSRYISSKIGKGTSNVSPLFSDNRARMSGIFRALDALVDFRFNNQEWTTLKEKYPNLKNYLEVPKEDRIYFTRGISLSLLARDIGKKILSDVGLAINEENATLGDESVIHQELGMIAIEALSSIGLVQTKPVTLGDVYNGIENSEAVEVRVILNLDNIFKNDGNTTKAMQFIDSLSRKFNLDNSNEVNTYSTTPFKTDRIVKTKKGVFAMPDKMYEAINAFLNTPFVVEHSDKVSKFIAQNEKALKTFLGYKDVSQFIEDRDLIKGVTPTILYNNIGIKYSDIDSVLGKNLQVEEDIRHLKELLVAKNSEGELIAQKGIYFNKTFSAGRQWIQSSTVNPQSKKLHRFLVTLQTQTREEKLDNEKLSDSTYVAIAQAFGYKTDKKTGAVDVGKAIVETEDLQAKVIEALGKKGHIELYNGTKLEIEEIGHALNALFNIEAFKEALEKAHKENKKLESFTHNIIAEVDGINNGIALKGLTFFASPKLFNPLLSTGISFHGELKDKTITQLFDASSSIKDEDSPGKRKANPDKAYDTYELFAIKTSESFKRLYKAISKEKYSDEEINKIKGLQNKDEKDVSPEEKELLAEYENYLEINNDINDLSKKLVKKDANLKEFTPKVKEVVSSFSKALVSMNNLIFVDGTNESIIESVPKEARSTNKFIVIPASYGSGLTANARSLTTYVMDNLKDWMLEYVDTASKDKATQEAFQNTSKYKMVVAILEAIDLSKVTLKYTNYNGNPVTIYFKGNGTSLENYNNVIKELILNSKESIGDIKVIDFTRATTPKAESLYEFVDRYMKIITIEAVRNSRDELLPGYEPINNSINSIHNSFSVILNAKYNEKAYDILKSRISNIKKENIPTELLTVAEHKKIMKELKKDFPSITVDSKIRFGKNKEKKHVGRLSTVNIQSKVSPTKNAVFIPSVYVGKDRNGKNIYMGNKTLTMSYERLEFGPVGATPTANITQQNDGSDMTDLSLEGRNEQGQIQQNDIFDAVTLNPAEYTDGEPTIISKYNENQIKRGLNSSQLYEQTALAAKAARDLSEVDGKFLSLSDLETKGFNPNSLQFSDPTSSTGVKKFSIQEILQIYYNNLAGTMHSYYTISEVNKAIVKQLEIIGSNMQNGEESDKAVIEPKRIDLAALIKNKGYDVREYVSDNLMIDITSKEISSKIGVIESYLNLIYDNKISNNKKDTDKITIETLDEEVKNLRSIIEGKIESIKENLKHLGASTFANDLTKYIQPLGEGPFSLKAQREEESGRDVYQDIEEVDKDKIDREAKDEEIKSKEEETLVEENNSSSSNSPTKNNEIKESTKPDTNTAKELEPNAEYQGDMEVIERLANALEQLLKPKSQKDKGVEGINLDVTKENISARVEKVKKNINDILRVGFNSEIDFRKLKGNNRFTNLKNSFKEKLEGFNVDEYLKDPTKYLENLFKGIVGEGSIFDKIYSEVLKSFENIDDTKVGDTSMDEFVSQIDLTTDKVSTTQEQMRSIDEANGRAMSKEFSNHLKGVLSELSSLASEAVNGVKVKYFKSKGKGHNEGEFLTNLREILIKEGIPLSKGNFTGTASLEETYGHELLHAITYYVIKAQAGGNPLTRELSMLHKRYLSVMTPDKLAKHINSGIPSKDLEVANRIIGHFENNTIEGLSEFIAIALSNEAVWNSLKDIEVKSDPNYDNMTFGERVVAKAMKMFNTFFNSIYRKYQDNDNMQKAMIALATKIATANSKAEYKIDKEMDYNTLETADTLTTVANSLATGLDKVDEVTSEKLNKLKDYIKSKGVKLVSVPKSRRRKYNSRWEEIRGLVAILASDVVGDKTAQAALSVAHDIGLHYNGVTQYVVSELSQMSEVKRKAEYLSRQRGLLDTNREREININTEALEEYFNTPLTLAENQALGEGMLDTDLSSLLDHYSIDELPDILNNIESYKEKAYSDMLKEVDINFKDRVGKYSKDDYKRYITNQANSLAYFMNFQSYRNEVEGAIGIKNPTMIAMAVGTGANLKPNKKVVSAIDKYVTLAALEYLESDVKDLIIDKLRTEPKGMEAMMNYHRTNKAESLEKNFGGNPALMMKGYRYDVVEDYIDIKIAPVSEESLLKSQGFRRVSKEPLRKSSDDNSEERAIYINDFIPSTASFNQQAVSYLGHTGRGSKLSDIYNDKIFKGADVHTVEQEWYDSIVDLTKNSSLAARKLMSPNYSPANYKDKKGSENIMIPIFDEHGDLRDFAYLMSKKTKKDLLGLDTSLTKSLSHMSARTTDKYEAQKLNERVADELYKDYAEANSAERQYHFVEMSFESKDPYIREIYKMLEPFFKNYLEEKFGGKIMVRASTMLNFFGQRDMDYRNTANYREKDVPYKKVLLASLDVARQVAKLAKMEIVLRFGSTIYNNFVSNGVTLLIRGVPITSIVKDQIEGGRLLNKYLKDTKELKKLEAKKKAGGDVRDVEIENLKRELERNPIRDMMEFGLFSTIQTFEDINLDDKDNSWTARQVRKYTVENENIPENVREWMQKGYDWAFVTDRTVIGKNLTKLVQMGDFVARYALYKHYMRDGKMAKKEALEKVSDEFINYDLPVNKAVKFANDYGFLFFTRYYLVSQKVMAMLASDRPVSAGLVVGLQSLFNTDFADIFDGNVLTKNAGELVSDPFTNLYRSLSPTGYDLVKGAYSRI